MRVALAGAAFAAAAHGQAPPQQPPAEPAPKPSAPTQTIEVTGGRESDAEQRRQSTAAKIVIGREEIERFGDSTVGEVLKRLPGVTISGPPGRGGPPRMRGLGAGYTQILIDGQRVPPGFSIESLTPDQIERIEILRAPTAETGARAIGGTINIITREGYKRRINDLRVGFAYENGEFSPGLSWTRNDSVDNLIYNLSASAFRGRRASANTIQLIEEDPASGALVREQLETNLGNDRRMGLNATGRLQWRLGSDTLVLMPVFFTSRAEGQRRYQLTQTIGPTPALYDHAATDTESRFTVGRLNAAWRSTLAGGARLELNGGAALARGESQSDRREFDAPGGLLRTIVDDGTTRDRTLTASTKISKLLESEHSLVSGAEVESLSRTETRSTLQNGRPLLLDEDNGDIQASSLRLAAYIQDEWNITPNWSAHAGVRWETIRTEGDAGDDQPPTNRSSVVTPLLHAVWKPDPKARDQVRMSLTRSYKSPTLQNLVARPSVSARYPVVVDAPPSSTPTNTPTSPDRGGNPELRPELATGVDIAVERYLAQGGVLSANVFRRRLKDYIRNVITLERVGYSPAPRWVSRPQNVGGAITQGVELEAKFRLDQAIDGALPVEVRSNVSLFRSKVDNVPGPDNRLDQQPKGTANFGADYRIRSFPLTLGGSLNFTPGYRTRVSEDQVIEVGRKRQFDAYALWVFNPGAQLRLLASNLTPEDYVSSNSIVDDLVRSRTRTVSDTYVNWQLRLELKL